MCLSSYVNGLVDTVLLGELYLEATATIRASEQYYWASSRQNRGWVRNQDRRTSRTSVQTSPVMGGTLMQVNAMGHSDLMP